MNEPSLTTSQAMADAFWARPPAKRRLSDLAVAFEAGDFGYREAGEALNRRAAALDEIARETFVEHSPERLTAQAEAQQALQAAGEAPRALSGVPVSIKDLFDVRGEVTRAGSRVLEANPPATQDAPAVARLRKAGALLAGRTTMSEFAFSGLGLNPHVGTPPNPHDAARITGGSTSGGAASVAFGLAAAALGSDTGGSLRIPAAFCGLVGFKPSQASVPGEGAYPLSPSLDCVGPIAPSVACCATLWQALSGQSPRLDPTPRPLRLAIPDGALLQGLDDAVAAAFEEAVASLHRLGWHLERLPLAAVEDAHAINQQGGLVVPEAAALHHEQLAEREADYDPFIAERLRGGREVLASDYLDRLWQRPGLQARFAAELTGFDAVLLPTVAMLPPERRALETDAEAFQAANRRALRNTSVFNYLDASAISLPYTAAGAELPIGLMLARPRGEDAALLQAASVVETVLQGHG
ncbi:amidase [Halomonas smyrnensis]|uniref:amidase n=1 Tax=Halomonas smyrnensis TaxID=720605 RepID=UPI0003124A50|nr:amidase [Halomonas smyrnensis]